MYITIDSELEDFFYEGNAEAEDYSDIETLIKFSESKYLLQANRDFYSFLKNNSKFFSLYMKNHISWLCNHITTRSPNINSKLIQPIVVITRQKFQFNKEKKLFYIPIKDFNKNSNCYFFSEDATDCDFYRKLAKRYAELTKCNISDYHFAFENCSTGGCNIKGLNDKLKEKKLCLAILDSDKDYRGSKLGETAKQFEKLKKQYDDKDWNYHQIILQVREKENLLPFELYYDDKTLRDNCPILKYFRTIKDDDDVLSFFDIADGMKKKNYDDNKNNECWKKVNSGAVNYAIKNNYVNTSATKDNIYITGIKKNAANNVDLNRVNIEQLCKTQLSDWKTIAENIIQFGIAPNEKNLSRIS